MLMYEAVLERINEDDDAISIYLKMARQVVGDALIQKTQEDVLADSDMALGDEEINRRIAQTFVNEFIFPEGTPAKFVFSFYKDGKNFGISAFESAAFTGFDLNTILKTIYVNAVR